MRRILAAGLILFLSSACMPQISLHPTKVPSYAPTENEQESSLFTPAEIEKFFPERAAAPKRRLSVPEDQPALETGDPDQRRVQRRFQDGSLRGRSTQKGSGV